MKVYIAGKVSGLPQEEVIAKFDKAESQVKDIGLTPVNPIKIVGDWNTPWETAMRKCIAALTECDAVYFLPDYKKSQGAMREYEISKYLKICQIYNYTELLNTSSKVAPGRGIMIKLGWVFHGTDNFYQTKMDTYRYGTFCIKLYYENSISACEFIINQNGLASSIKINTYLIPFNEELVEELKKRGEHILGIDKFN